MDNEELQNDLGATAPKPVTEEVDVKPMPDVNEGSTEAEVTTTGEKDATPVVTDFLPSIKRKADDDLTVDENFNFDYILKNGKKLAVSVAKPNLQISTALSDQEIKFSANDDGSQTMMANTLGVYTTIMKELIKVILVDGAPMASVSFKNLSKIGMTKGELDDFMNVINTFYLS